MCCVERLDLLFSRPILELQERYALLDRLRRNGERNGVQVLAFRLRPGQLQVLVEGLHVDIRRALLGFRRGMAHSYSARGDELRVTEGPRRIVLDLESEVARLHDLGVSQDPLASPWTSHRDLLDLRKAPFFEAEPLRERVDPLAVHRRCGGGPLPEGWPPSEEGRIPLGLLLRVASSVLGVLPADRRSFAIFAHLARRAGYRVRPIAQALTLTPRRVRQLLESDPEGLAAAVATLSDLRLIQLP